ncbi:MAG: BMP family ABC transporter substrate-binding protein [Coriobacteriia bacterium]|nr:BMP family ABC transporter substrate-binding protein [Coriobacteriia bacterium]MCL2745920.1 BMP family ABC transporter substrate-binding protein [Coriobacteriia bacterium]MCL2870860.1 BMP family ABC transporter substrate-binding protein [Coriobacteriia bacterium]
MNWKKVLLIAFALVLTMGLVACDGDDPVADIEEALDPDNGDAISIVVVTSPSGVDDGSFNQNNYEGVQNFIEHFDGEVNVNTIREPEMDNAVNAVEQIVANYDIVVLPGFQFAGITPVAEANPDTYFILVDTFPVDEEGEEVELANVFAMRFAEQESGFFAGIAAALETETGKVAFVGGGAIPPVVNYHFGFDSGVNFANAHLGTDAEIVELAAFSGTDVRDIEIGGNYVGTFNDEARGKQIGDALIAEDVDIMFVAAGGSGNGAFTAAKEADDVMVIGCDVDQFDLGVDGDRNVVLTSALKVMDLNVERQIQAIVDGAFVGGNYVMQADTESTGMVTLDGRHQLHPDTVTAILEAFDGVKIGDIVPPGNFSDDTPDDFPGL